MKRISLFLFWAIGLLFLASCHVSSGEMRAMMGKPNGPRVTRVLKAQYFSKIDADLVGDIIYTQSDSMSIRLVGPKAEVEHMQVSRPRRLILTTYRPQSTALGIYRLTL